MKNHKESESIETGDAYNYQDHIRRGHGGATVLSAVTKRVFDLTVAIVMLALAAPFLILLLIAVRLESRGPSIFSQKRVGRAGQLFRCHKIRTMIISSPEVPSHEIARANVTRVGRILRKTKLDELPQLWNVIMGEMSLVGPRPSLPSQSELIKARFDRGVLDLLPGITGLAQVKGIDMSEPLLLSIVDQEYAQKRSLLLDINIMWRTVSARRSRGRSST